MPKNSIILTESMKSKYSLMYTAINYNIIKLNN